MEKLITIIGATSSGKSGLAIELAKQFNGEIVSADSRQVYKGLDWCSGKVTKDEIAEVKHHLIDVANLGEQYTLFDFQKAAYSAIDDIISRGKVPFLVGGTGLYSRAVAEGYNLLEVAPDAGKREDLEKLSKEELIALCEKLGIVVEGEITQRRLVRAIETKDIQKQPNNPRYEVLQIGIAWQREELYKRIGERLEMRMPHMIEEIKSLLESGVRQEFLRSLGLEAKFIVDYLNGEFSSYEEFFAELFKEERHFAKRQNTWHKKEKNVVWLDATDNLFENASKTIDKFLKN